MKQRAIAGFLALAMGTGPALAATVFNKDNEAQMLVVVEGGNRMEVVVKAGARVQICPSGCFVTMPSGDREALAGDETFDIENGTAVFR